MNLHYLPRISDRISYIYIDHAKISQKNTAFTITKKDNTYSLPIANYLVLLLGPGTSITQQAIKLASQSGTTLIWTQSNITKTLAVCNGTSLNSSSKAIELQAKAFSNKKEHLLIARKMYQLRFPNENFTGLSLAKMRGKEGFRMKQIYQINSKKYGVPWYGRDYDPQHFERSDLINQNLTIANQILYGICTAVILALGFSPALGFIHVGLQNSFVYDLADLYKASLTIPAAFESTKTQTDIKKLLSKKLYDQQLLKQITTDLLNLFDIHEPLVDILYLWDNIQGFQTSGLLYLDK